MSQLNFPANPEVGDPYEPAGLNVVYTWNGTVWEATVPVNDSGAFVPLSGDTEMTGNLQTPGVDINNTGADTVLINLERASASQLQITAEPAVTVLQPLDLKLPDDNALPFRIMEGTNEYLRVTTTDDAEQFTFSKGVTLNQVLTLGNSVDTTTGANSGIINIQGSDGQALRINDASKTGNAAELFRINTNTTPSVADFSCDVKLDGDVEAAFNTLTVSQNLDIVIPNSSSNGLDIVADGATSTFGLRFNTSQQQLITDYDIVNDNNDGVIQLGGTVASPNLQLVGDGTATFGGAISATGNVTAGLFQQAGSSGYPTNSGTSHFYSDVSIGFTGSQSQLSSNVHLSKFIIQRNYAGQEGGLIVKGGRPGEAANGTQNILSVHYQDVAAGDDIRYHGSTANSHSLQNKTSVNTLIDAKVNPSAITSNSTSVTLKQPTTTDSTLTMGGNLLPASASIDIGTQSSKFNNLHINQINDTGDLVVSGDIFLGNNALDTISMRANIITSLSSSSSSNTIGSSTAPWGTIYTAKSVQAGIDSTSHSAHISMNEDGSLKLRNLTGLSQLTTTPSTGLLAMISNKLYIYIATGWKEVNLTAATPPS